MTYIIELAEYYSILRMNYMYIFWIHFSLLIQAFVVLMKGALRCGERAAKGLAVPGGPAICPEN
jgi:hypothetical protein